MSAVDRRQAMASAIAALTGASAAMAIAGRVAMAEQPDHQTAGPFAVHDGESRSNGPWIIRGKDPAAAKVAGPDVAGRYSLLEVTTPPGRGPELHVHLAQNELFFLLHGTIGLQCGPEQIVLKQGDAYMAPLNVPHAYVTLGTETARMLSLYDPAGSMESFFAEYTSILNADGPPDRQRLEQAYLRHGMKVAGPPLLAAKFTL